VESNNLVILFRYKNYVIENQLRTAKIGENRLISDVLQILQPQYVTNLRSSILQTMLSESIVYIDALARVNDVISNMTPKECTQFKLITLNGIGPLWISVVTRKKSHWFKELNNYVTHRATRRQEGNECY